MSDSSGANSKVAAYIAPYLAHPFFQSAARRNVRLIVEALALYGPSLPRSELADRTGMSEWNLARAIGLGQRLWLIELSAHPNVALRRDWEDAIYRPDEDALRAIRVRADALGVTSSFYDPAPPTRWQEIAKQAAKDGAVLVIDKNAAQPMVVMPLSMAEELAGIASS